MNYKHNILTLNIFNCLRIPNPESRLNFERKELLKISFPNDRNLPSS